jgi:hypothetical protein
MHSASAACYDGSIMPEAYAAVPRCQKPVDTRVRVRLLRQGR